MLLRLAENLHNIITFQVNGRNMAGNPRKRQDLSGIENEIIFFCLHALDLAVLDEIGDIQPKQVHEALHGKMQRFHFLRVQPDFSVSGGAQLAFRLKTDVAFLV